jgi:hypothetical protein
VIWKNVAVHAGDILRIRLFFIHGIKNYLASLHVRKKNLWIQIAQISKSEAYPQRV